MPRKPLENPVSPAELDAEVRRATRIIPERIDDEFAAVPSDVFRWGRVVAEADEALDLAEEALKGHENERGKQILEAVPAGEKPPGEDRLKMLVRAEASWRSLARAEIKARRVKADALAVLEAIRQKASMLISLGASMRADREAAERGENGIRDRGRGGSGRA
jgi:hypothetical protein